MDLSLTTNKGMVPINGWKEEMMTRPLVQDTITKDRQMSHRLYFSPREALAIGLNEAIVVERLRFWLERSTNVPDGRPWVYNTYGGWQEQFPFWSERTLKTVFRRLERLGVVESTQRFNKNRWNKTKWYTLNPNALAALMSAERSIDGAQSGPLDGTATAPVDRTQCGSIEGANLAPSLKTERSSERSTKRSSSRACACEPNEEARPHPLQTPPDAKTQMTEAWSDVDAAFERIPSSERSVWLEQACRKLEKQGTPWLASCVPIVRSEAVSLWQQA